MFGVRGFGVRAVNALQIPVTLWGEGNGGNFTRYGVRGVVRPMDIIDFFRTGVLGFAVPNKSYYEHWLWGIGGLFAFFLGLARKSGFEVSLI